MSLIIADTDRNGITLGSDSAVSFEGKHEVYSLQVEKIFRRGPYLFGLAGYQRVNEVLRYSVELPDPPESVDIEKFLVREFAPAIHQAMVDAGITGTGSLVLPDSTDLLLGCHGQLFTIAADLSLTCVSPFFAAGSGRHAAHGAIHALRASGVESARRRIELVLAAVEASTPFVRRPWQFISSDEP